MWNLDRTIGIYILSIDIENKTKTKNEMPNRCVFTYNTSNNL